ncbi:unnamed protein product [Durusdinium trenchii]|uniref:Uncharacterized protein n=1 Tax=Durusdinium trenchii TaxID=1381693 RepID=A0ABP0PXY4_9DINO
MSAEQADEAEAALCQDIFDAASQGRVAAVRHFLRGNAALVNEESTTGRSLLHLAMDTDVVELMELLLRSHADVNFADWLGQTVLHLACARSLDPPIGVLRLLDARAQVNEIDEFGLTPLHKAAERGQVALIQSLLEAQANACATTPEGITPLGLAREGLHSAAVEVLQHPDLYVDLEPFRWDQASGRVPRGASPVSALSTGEVMPTPASPLRRPGEVLRTTSPLRRAGEVSPTSMPSRVSQASPRSGKASSTSPRRTVEVQTSPLFRTNQASPRSPSTQESRTSSFIMAGEAFQSSPRAGQASRPSSRPRAGQVSSTAPCRARQGSSRSSPSRASQASPSSSRSSQVAVSFARYSTNLLDAAEKGLLGDVRHFLRLDPTAVRSSYLSGQTALHGAASKGHVDVVRELLRRRALLDSATELGHTPLHLAARAGHVDVVNALRHAKAQVQMAGQGCWTALHLAAAAGHSDVIHALLVVAKARANSVNEDGQTPLHLAAAGGHAGAVKELLRTAGFLRKAVDHEGRSARFLAVAKGHAEVVQILSEHQDQCRTYRQAGAS